MNSAQNELIQRTHDTLHGIPCLSRTAYALSPSNSASLSPERSHKTLCHRRTYKKVTQKDAVFLTSGPARPLVGDLRWRWRCWRMGGGGGEKEEWAAVPLQFKSKTSTCVEELTGRRPQHAGRQLDAGKVSVRSCCCSYIVVKGSNRLGAVCGGGQAGGQEETGAPWS